MTLAASLALLTLGIVQGSTWGWASPKIIGAFAASVALAALFIRRCSWHRSPVVELPLLRQRDFSLTNVATTVAGMGFYAALLCNALYLIAVWHYSPLEAGLAFVPAALVAAVTAAVAGRVAEKHGFRVLIVPGALVYAAAYLWYHQRVGRYPDFLGEWLPGGIVSGIGAGLTLPQLGAAAIAAAKGTKYAVAGALSTTARQLGGALGIAIVVVIIGQPSPDSLRSGWLFVMAAFALVAAVVAAVPGLRPAEAVDDDEDDAEPAFDARPSFVTGAVDPLPRFAHATLDTGADGFLRSLPVLEDLPAHQQDRLVAGARPVLLAAGDWLFHEGDAVDGIYAVRAGRLDALRNGAVVAEHARGDLIGELAILTGSNRGASVRARRDCDLLHIPYSDVHALLLSGPEFALALGRRLAGTLRERALVEMPAASVPATIAVVGAGMPAGIASRPLARALGQVARLAEVHASDVVSGDAAGELDRAERTSDHVLLVADPVVDGAEWTDFCVRQADRVVLVGGPTPPSEPLPVPAAERLELLLPSGADGRAWSAALPSASHSHGADGAAALARRLAGRSLGLVLGGGGARALAHVGAVAELERAGLRVDRVGGSGMGALVAALLASGMDAAEIDARLYDELVRRDTFGDYRVSRHSLIRGERVREMLDRLFGETTIQELPRDFFCVSADLNAGERVVHRSGRVADALLAAMSIPGLMPPVADGGRLLVDAGSIDSLPVSVMAEDGEGPIVAIDVSDRERGPALIEPARRDRAGAALPGLRETVSRAAVLGSLREAEEARRAAALTVVPDVDGAGLLEFHQVDELLAAGRRAARTALANGGGRALEAQL
jgi:predicted acylesterase/phospholipase RssA/CRP-like cAMP-binding protein